MRPRGDTIVEFDWTVGQVLDALDRLKLSDNTLVIITSDNGGILDNNGPTVHRARLPAGEQRPPFQWRSSRDERHGLGRWHAAAIDHALARPHQTRRVGRALICQVDMLASFAALTGQKLAEADGPDSFNVLPALLGEKLDKPCRDYLAEQDNKGARIALRYGTWKYIPTGNGVNQGKTRIEVEDNPLETVLVSELPANNAQLYDLAKDLSETKDVAAAHPDIVALMSAKLKEIKQNARSRP